MVGELGKPVVVEKDLDILIVGGGMASCGAATSHTPCGSTTSSAAMLSDSRRRAR